MKGNRLEALACFALCAVYTTVWAPPEGGSANIKTIGSFKEAEESFKQCDENTIVFFDLDEVLVCEIDSLRAILSEGIYSWPLSMRYFDWRKSSVREWCHSTIYTENSECLVEPNVVNYIEALKESKATVLGLTATMSGSSSVIQDIPSFRVNRLREAGITFSTTFKETVLCNTSFKQFITSEQGSPPLFRDGILFSSGKDKGKVAMSLLEYAELSPEKILFFDDREENLNDMSTSCQQDNIPVELFLCEAYKKVKREPLSKEAVLTRIGALIARMPNELKV